MDVRFPKSDHCALEYQVDRGLERKPGMNSCLTEKQDFTFDINPCLGKKGSGEDLVCVLIHVDDIMFTGREKPVDDSITQMKEFENEVSMVKNYGEECSFLKRK